MSSQLVRFIKMLSMDLAEKARQIRAENATEVDATFKAVMDAQADLLLEIAGSVKAAAKKANLP